MATETNIERFSDVRDWTYYGVDNIMDEPESISDRGEEGIEHIKVKDPMMREDMNGHVRGNPKKSVLIGAGVGAVIGALLAAVMMRRKD